MSESELRKIANLPRIIKHRSILLKHLIEKHNSNEITEKQFNQVIRHLGGIL